jgi:hypothetical protein
MDIGYIWIKEIADANPVCKIHNHHRFHMNKVIENWLQGDRTP